MPVRINEDGTPVASIEDFIGISDPDPMEESAAAATESAFRAIQYLMMHAHRGDAFALAELVSHAKRICEFLDCDSSTLHGCERTPLGEEALANWNSAIKGSASWPVVLPADSDYRSSVINRIDQKLGSQLPIKPQKIGKNNKRPRDRSPGSPSSVAAAVVWRMCAIREQSALVGILAPVELKSRIRSLPPFTDQSFDQWKLAAAELIEADPITREAIPAGWYQIGKQHGKGTGTAIRQKLWSGMHTLCPKTG